MNGRNIGFYLTAALNTGASTDTYTSSVSRLNADVLLHTHTVAKHHWSTV